MGLTKCEFFGCDGTHEWLLVDMAGSSRRYCDLHTYDIIPNTTVMRAYRLIIQLNP